MKLEITFTEKISHRYIIDTSDYTEHDKLDVFQIANVINEIKDAPRTFIKESGEPNLDGFTDISNVGIEEFKN